MCSNNDNNACGGGASLRKNKRPRVPKRGPGVAELERVLSEQKQQQGRGVQRSDMVKLGGSSNCSSSQSLIPSGFQQYSHSSVPFRSVTSVPDQFQTHFGNGTGNVGSYNGCNGSNVCGGSYGNASGRGVRIGGSGVVLPENALIPSNWGSGEQQSGRGAEGSRVAAGFPFPPQMGNGSDQSQHMAVPPHQYPMMHKKQCQFHPSMVNLFVPPTFSDPSAPFSAGMYQHFHVEPPSNQRVAQNYSSTWPKEDQASAYKTQWPFAGDSHPVAPSITSQPPRWPPGIHMLGSSSSTGNNVMLSLGARSSSFAPRMEKPVMDNGAPNASYFCPPSVPSPWPRTCQQEFSKVNPFQLQEFNEGYEESYQRSATDELTPQKPCYSFFPVEQRMGGPEDTTLGLSNERSETRDVIDLNLKL